VERFGTHRSLEPVGVLPQQALKLDALAPLTADEMAIDVDHLNIDSASWRQLLESTGGSADAMAQRIVQIVAERGKMHNPDTGSGGMLVGTVSELGSHRTTPAVGTRIATLVSLSLTPLVLDEIVALDPESATIEVRGRAILFGSGIFAEVPSDLPDAVVLGVLDVCGSPAWMAKLARPGMKVVVIGGGGKSGMLACAQAIRIVGDEGRVVALCYPEETAGSAKLAGAEAIVVDCTNATAVAEAISDSFAGDEAELVFVCTNVPGCEGGAILGCSDQGRIVFFSMATSFTAAALLAEGLGKACEMTIGNGYVPGHAELALDLVRSDERLIESFS
jgi:L-erythro-3,5-diaminohexanoate dehydrogenase